MKSASNGGDERVVGIGSRISLAFPPGRVTFSAKGNVPGLRLEGWEESKGFEKVRGLQSWLVCISAVSAGWRSDGRTGH